MSSFSYSIVLATNMFCASSDALGLALVAPKDVLVVFAAIAKAGALCACSDSL